MIRQIVAIIGGVIIVWILGVATSGLPVVPHIVPLLAGGSFAGYVGRRRGWLLGTIVALIDLILTIALIRRIVSANISPPPSIIESLQETARAWRTALLPLLSGPLGGCLGEWTAAKCPRSVR